MGVKIEDGKLIITLECFPEPKVSASGKSLLVASTSGNLKTTTMVNGKPLTIAVNAYIAKD